MGMVASLEQITSQQLAEFLQDPQRAYDYVFSQLLEDPASMNFFDEILRQAEGNAGQIPGLRAQIERIQGQAHALKTRAGIHLVKGRRKPSEQTQVKQERKQFSLEKDWHVLHYLLNGTAKEFTVSGRGAYCRGCCPAAGSLLLSKDFTISSGLLDISCASRARATVTMSQ